MTSSQISFSRPARASSRALSRYLPSSKYLPFMTRGRNSRACERKISSCASSPGTIAPIAPLPVKSDCSHARLLATPGLACAGVSHTTPSLGARNSSAGTVRTPTRSMTAPGSTAVIVHAFAPDGIGTSTRMKLSCTATARTESFSPMLESLRGTSTYFASPPSKDTFTPSLSPGQSAKSGRN